MLKTLIDSIAPPLLQVRAALMEAWFWWRTFGLRPDAPDHARIALKRAELNGGVRVR